MLYPSELQPRSSIVIRSALTRATAERSKRTQNAFRSVKAGHCRRLD